jgi:hypothetical protein
MKQMDRKDIVSVPGGTTIIPGEPIGDIGPIVPIFPEPEYPQVPIVPFPVDHQKC